LPDASGVTPVPPMGEPATLGIVEGATVEMLGGYRPDRFT